MNRYWVFFLLGVSLPYVIKVGNFLLRTQASEHNGSIFRALWAYIFEDVQARITTVMTFGAEGLIGAVYVDRLPLPFAPVADLPLHVASAFFLGTISELIAPLLIKKVVSWFN